MKHLGIIIAVAIVLIAHGAMAQTDNPAPPDWITVTNQPCRIWNPNPQADESATWSGPCKDGMASGKGVLRWTENGHPDVEFDGQYENGKRNGPGVMVTPDGKRLEGSWVDDELIVPDRNSI